MDPNRFRIRRTIVKRDATRVLSDKAFIFVTLSQLLLLSLSITFAQFLPLFISGDVGVPANFAKVGIAADGILVDGFLSDGTIYERVEEDPGLVFFETGIYDGLVVSKGFAEKANTSEPLLVEVYVKNGPKAPTVMMRTRRVLAKVEDKLRADRSMLFPGAHKEYVLDAPTGFDQPDVIYTVLMPLFMIFVSVVAGNLYITLAASELEEGTIDVLLAAGAQRADIVASKALTAFGLVFGQFISWTCVFFITDMQLSHPFLFLAYGGTTILLFVCLGMISYSVTGTRDSAQNVYSVFILLPVAALLPFGTFPSVYSHLASIAPSNVIANLALSENLGLGTCATVFLSCALVLVLFLASSRHAARI